MKKRIIQGVFVAVAALVVTMLGYFIIQKKDASRLSLVAIPSASPQELPINATPEPTEQPMEAFVIPQATLTVLKGSVTITRGAKTMIVKDDAPSGTHLEEADDLLTNENSVAEIAYTSDSMIRMAPNTHLVFHLSSDDSEKEGFIEHLLGTISVHFIKLLGVQEEFRVETPTAVAVVRGTKFIVQVLKDKQTKLSVIDHAIDVYRKDERTRRMSIETQQTVKEKQRAIIDGKKQITLGDDKPDDIEKRWMTFNEDADVLRAQQVFAQTTLRSLAEKYVRDVASRSASVKPAVSLKIAESMPGDGYSKTLVKTEYGDFPLSCIGANKHGIRVVTDAANENDCKNDCAVMPLESYAQRNGAFAAINGMYFCPSDYSWCGDKKNSFDTLLFHSRAKRYINSDNNVYSTLPFFVFDGGGTPKFVGKTQEWGRDTGIQAGIAGNPMLVKDGRNVVEEYSIDAKQRSGKGPKGAIAQKGEMMYLCIVSNATVPESAQVFSKLGADNAMNIDGGGSAALWYNGVYKIGPGRQLPNAVLFVRR
ncbi:MAG: phosphodiester glycosidase family protein [Candidatus Pacebacteria bacterium]|nr:phosphodiester glycosidase family protein [Candidatus Paceibacterota bacterium]